MNVFDEIRKEYETRGLDRVDLSDDPMVQFDSWFKEAIEKSPGRWTEANAMTLSTCVNNFVTSRTVLLKEYENQEFIFFTNYASEKGQQMLENPSASLLFHWPYLGRQIRINGHVKKTSLEKSEKYFHSRPRGSQLGASVSTQSSVLPSREHLEQLRRDLDQKHEGQVVPLPETWGGFALTAVRFEFWQGRLDRLHDRFQFVQEGDGWNITRLYP